jgi:predicted RNA-binding protein with PIN domain
MSGKKTIRVVKKSEQNREQKVVNKKNTARETAREMVQNVTNWVTEFQQKRRTETAAALKILSETPPPTRA